MTVVPRLGLRLFVGLTLLNASLADAYEAETHRQLSDSAFTASGIAETLQHAYGIDPSALLRQQIIGFPGGRRTARRSHQRLARQGAQYVRPRIRLLLHGL